MQRDDEHWTRVRKLFGWRRWERKIGAGLKIGQQVLAASLRQPWLASSEVPRFPGDHRCSSDQVSFYWRAAQKEIATGIYRKPKKRQRRKDLEGNDGQTALRRGRQKVDFWSETSYPAGEKQREAGSNSWDKKSNELYWDQILVGGKIQKIHQKADDHKRSLQKIACLRRWK